jgi:cell wall-associated NlpC family hydrolase
MTWRDDIVAQARTWLGTHWHHNARVKGAGVDCGQFIIAAYIDAGLVADFATGQYPADWMLHQSDERFLGWVTMYLDEVKAPLPGDVAVWKYGMCYSHGAIVLDWPQIIHSYRREGGVVVGDATKGEVAREVRFFSIERRL